MCGAGARREAFLGRRLHLGLIAERWEVLQAAQAAPAPSSAMTAARRGETRKNAQRLADAQLADGPLHGLPIVVHRRQRQLAPERYARSGPAVVLCDSPDATRCVGTFASVHGGPFGPFGPFGASERPSPCSAAA
jgi:hypothetical protein